MADPSPDDSVAGHPHSGPATAPAAGPIAGAQTRPPSEPGEHDDGEHGGQPHGLPATAPYRFAEQHTAPPAQRVSEVAQTTFEHVYEVDPRLMEQHVLQQVFPNWDTLRIMRSRSDHLAWMHAHFAGTVVTGSELLAEVEREG